MHIPDGFIDAPVSVAAGVAAIGLTAVAVKKAADELDERRAPLAGLVAAFVFAVQMLNFPVAGGTSGHLLGGVLAAVLVGPWTGAICVALVLLIQGLVFADGGLSALGLNVVNMGLIGAIGGYLVYRLVLRLLRSRLVTVAPAAGVAAFISVPLAALGFFVEFVIGGTVESISLSSVLWAILGTHLLIGIGEGMITFLVVGAVMGSRPDLVYGSPSFGGLRSEELVA
jgi:cobalt/nickel transport system permease protein